MKWWTNHRCSQKWFVRTISHGRNPRAKLRRQHVGNMPTMIRATTETKTYQRHLHIAHTLPKRQRIKDEHADVGHCQDRLQWYPNCRQPWREAANDAGAYERKWRRAQKEWELLFGLKESSIADNYMLRDYATNWRLLKNNIFFH